MKQWTGLTKKLPPENALVLAKVQGLKIHGESSPLRIENIKCVTGISSTGLTTAWFLKRHHYHEGTGDWLAIRPDQILKWADEVIEIEEKPKKEINNFIKIYEGEILEAIYEIIKKNLELDKDVEIDMLSKFSDFNMDTLHTVETVMDIEKKFDIKIPDKKADKMKGVMDLYVYLCKVLDPVVGKGEIDDRFEILDL
jgi:acyl carrier protein